MASNPVWLKEIKEYIFSNYPAEAEILDVGCGKGMYFDHLGVKYKNMDAVEVFEEVINKNNLREKYREVFLYNVVNFSSEKRYNLTIMGDCLEHLSVNDAKSVIKNLKSFSDECLFVVPYEYPQDAINGNEFEIHLQPDLTPFNIRLRYPDLYPLFIMYDNSRDRCNRGIGVYSTLNRYFEKREYLFKEKAELIIFKDLYFNELGF